MKLLLSFAIALAVNTLTACGSSDKKADPPAPVAKAATPTEAKAAPAAKAEVAAAPAANVTSVVKCEYESAKREIRILTEDDKCRVEYAKDGTTTNIANGAATSGYCAEIQERVKNNLVTAGYKCE